MTNISFLREHDKIFYRPSLVSVGQEVLHLTSINLEGPGFDTLQTLKTFSIYLTDVMIIAPMTCLSLNRLQKCLIVGRKTSIETNIIIKPMHNSIRKKFEKVRKILSIFRVKFFQVLVSSFSSIFFKLKLVLGPSNRTFWTKNKKIGPKIEVLELRNSKNDPKDHQIIKESSNF